MDENQKEPEREDGFDQFKLSPALLKSLDAMGYVTPTEVQWKTIPKVFEGGDLIVQSRTGTGKTAAYGIPMVERIDPGMLIVQSLVLTPTRELAVQVGEELTRIGKDREVRALTVYGGDSIERQIEGIRQGAQVIIGTPGRIPDHLKRKTLSFTSVKLLVLDEADRMLDMGFYREMKQIFDFLPGSRQTLMFSATFPKTVDALTYNYLTDPEKILLSEDYVYVKEVEHLYCISAAMHKEKNLFKLLVTEKPHSAMIFCNTRAETRLVSQFLWKRGMSVEMLSSDLPQSKREKVMERVRRGEVRFLVTTDVAARGIDIEDLSHVFIFSTPSSPDQYVHRAGRTGRKGKSGKAITLLGASDIIDFNRLVNVNELEVTEMDLPADEAVATYVEKQRIDQLVEMAGSLTPEDRLRFEGLANALLQREDVRDRILMFLLKESMDRKRREVERRSESADTAERMGRVAGRERGGRSRSGRRPRSGSDRGRSSRRDSDRGDSGGSRTTRGRGSRTRIGSGPSEVVPPPAETESTGSEGATKKRRRRRRRRRSSSGATAGDSTGAAEIAGEGIGNADPS